MPVSQTDGPVKERPLKILMVDKYYYVKGGPERYFFEVQKVLERHGHTVIPFSMADEKNVSTPFADCFVDHIDFDYKNPMQKLIGAPRAVGRVIYSFHARRQLEKLIARVKPDVAHLHMIDHQISPSILHTLKKHHIPVVQSVHQYKMVCPNYRMYIEHKQEICERCLGGCYHHAVMQRCHKQSLAGSLLVALESTLHRWMKLYDSIAAFHVPSRFIGRKLVEGGTDASRVHHQFLTLNLDEYPYHEGFDAYFLYFGRLSGEKGIKTLIEAVAQMPTHVPCYIVGEGPSRAELEAYAKGRNLDQIRFLGYQSGQALKDLIAKAMFVVVPSEWYENSPLVIYEPFCMGTPVIGAEIGGIPEFIREGENGWLFPSGDRAALTERLEWAVTHPKQLLEMGLNARRFAELNFTPERHYQWLHALYCNLIDTF